MGTLFSFKNWIDTPLTVITPDSEVTTNVGTNVATRLSFQVWRSLGDTAGISIDLGVVRPIQVIFIQFPRYNGPDDYDDIPDYTATDTIAVKLSAVTADAGEVLDTGADASGVLAGFGTYCLVLPAEVNARYIRLDFDAPSRTTEGFIDVARIWAGPKLQSAINIVWGGNLGWQSDSVISRAARSTSKYISAQEPGRVWQFNFDLIKDSERNAFEDFERRMTTAGQFIVMIDDLDAGRNVMMALNATSNGLSFLNKNQNSKVFRVLEDY